MKYIVFTFDDGRSDNYSFAKRIMDKYQFRGTVYVTTGFIDGTWEGMDVLKSPTRPLTAEEIKALHEAGWEIGLHGDKHQTQVDDMRTALKKLEYWGVENYAWSISVPNSTTSEADVERILDSDYGDKIAYIRRGRRCDTSKLKNKILFVIYSILKLKSAYRLFNADNVLKLDNVNRANVPCVVVKSNDSPKLILDFANKLPDKSVLVLMLHSILPSSHELCGKDPWSWDEALFDQLCAGIKSMEDCNDIKVLPLIELF